jgi:hypothetical protein
LRLIACGGETRAERARIGSWPEIPRALLLDVRGLARDRSSFGLGLLQGRLFLIHRELAVEGEEAAAYSVLFEPRRKDFERFRWNPAWLLASLLADSATRRLLIERPEQVSEGTLSEALDHLTPLPLETAPMPDALAGLLTRAALETGRLEAPDSIAGGATPLTPGSLAALFEGVPVALRTGRGWLVGGHDSNAEQLGCALWIGDAPLSSPEAASGVATRERVERMATTNATVAELLAMPASEWEARGQGLIHGLRTIELLETRPAHAWELLDSVPVREGPLAAEIRAAALRAIDGWKGPFESEPTRMLVEEIEAGRHACDAALVARFDRGAVLRHLSAHQVPPAPWPMWIEHAPALKTELWTRRIAESERDGPALAALAMADLAPDGRSETARDVVAAAIEAARLRSSDPLEWEAFAAWPDYPEWRSQIGTWVRQNVVKMRGDWTTAYVALGDDPGGRALASGNVAAPVAARIVTIMVEALVGPRSGRARKWLEALATSPLRDALPIKLKLEIASAVNGPWAALNRLRKICEGAVVAAEAAPSEERTFLAREFEPLAARTSNGPADLAPLYALFGGALPERMERVVAKWRKATAAAAPRTAPRWITDLARRWESTKAASEKPSRPAAAPSSVEKDRKTVERRPPAKMPEVKLPKVKLPPATPPMPLRAQEPPPPPKVVPPREAPPRTAPQVVRASSPPPPPKAAPPREAPPTIAPPVVRAAPPSPPRADPPREVPPVAAPPVVRAPAPPPPPPPASVEEPALDMKGPLRAWIIGGSAADDQHADQEMIQFFEQAGPRERAAARAALEGFSNGMLFRLAGRAATNARLLDGISRVLSDHDFDPVVGDAAHYDLVGFAAQVTERVRNRLAGSAPAPADDAVFRLLRIGPQDLRVDLMRELRRLDQVVATEAMKLASGLESGSDGAAA